MPSFPVLPMMVLVVSMLSAWIVELSLSSYAGYMVEFLGVVEDKDKAGYYAGILLSALMTGRIVSAYSWGVVADRYGHRPVIFISLGFTAVLAVGFGVSTTFFWAFFFRFLLGLLNGLIPLWPTLVSEVCGKEHEVLGMSLITMVWSLGALLGSGIGGVLAQPAAHYPFTFSESGLFGRFPYLLPNLFGGSLSLLSLSLALCFFPNTVPKAKTDTIELTSSFPGSSCSDDDDDDDEESTADGRDLAFSSASAPVNNASWADRGNEPCALSVAVEKEGFGGSTKGGSLLAEPHIRFLLFTFAIYSFAIAGVEDVYALWALSTVPKGGLDWSTKEIGQVLLMCGMMVFTFELLVLPVLLKRVGICTCRRVGAAILVPAFLLLPQLSSLQGTGYPIIVASVAVLFTIYVACDSFYTGISLAINNACSPDRRGQLNGIASSVASVAGAVGPAVWLALFAFSIEGGRHAFPFDFHLTFYVMAALRLAVAFCMWDASLQEEGVADHN